MFHICLEYVSHTVDIGFHTRCTYVSHTHINVIKCVCLIRNVFAFGVQFTCDSDAFYKCFAWPLRIRLPFLGNPPGNGKKPEDGEGAIGGNCLVG